MQFFVALGAFLKSLPAITELMQKLLDFIALQTELHKQQEINAQMAKEIEQLRAAVAAAQSSTHDNTQLNDMFNGVKK